MKHIAKGLIIFLLAAGSIAGASAETTGRGGLFFGQKSMDHGDWGDLDSHAAWGVNLDVKDKSWPVWITSAFISSHDEEKVVTSVSPFATTDIEAETTEVRLGIKKDFWPLQRVRLSLGAGPAYMRGQLQRSVAPYDKDSDSTVGGWAGADLIFNLNVIALGVSYQYSRGDVDLLGRSRNAGGSSLAFSLGFGW